MLPRVFDQETRKKISAMRMRVNRVFSGEGGGAIRARGIGSGHDFHDHRAYTEGDDFRHIDWNLFGRHGDLFIKRFRHVTDIEFIVLLDQSSSMSIGSPTKDVFARRLACALAACFANNGQPFEFRLASIGLPVCAPRIRNEADLEGAMSTFETMQAPHGKVEFQPDGDWARGARNRVILYLGDFLDAANLMTNLASLKNDKTEIICALLCAAEERSPTLRGKVDLEDIEGNEHLRFSITPALLDRYVQKFDAHLEDCRKQALGHGMPLTVLSSETPLEEAVISLARRGALVQ